MAVPHIGRFMSQMSKHPKQLALSWYVFFFQLRGISDYAVRRNNHSFIRMLWRRWSPGWQPPEEELRDVIRSLQEPGVTRATLRYYRNLMSPRTIPLGAAARQKAAFEVGVPTLALTGERDGCIDSDVFQALMKEADFPGGLSVRQIANAGHFPHQEQADVVNALLLDWFGRHNDRQ